MLRIHFDLFLVYLYGIGTFYAFAINRYTKMYFYKYILEDVQSGHSFLKPI